jgi:hypothetical protein
MLGALSVVLGARLVTLGARCVMLGARLVTLGARLVTLGAHCVVLGARLVTLGARCVMLGALRLTLGARCVMLGALCLTLGAPVVTLGAHHVTLGALGYGLPGSFSVRCGLRELLCQPIRRPATVAVFDQMSFRHPPPSLAKPCDGHQRGNLVRRQVSAGAESADDGFR